MNDILFTEHLMLEPVGMADHGALLTHWTAPQVRRFLVDDRGLTGAEVAEIIADSRRDFALTGYGLWALRLLDGASIAPSLIGVAGLRRVEEEEPALLGPGPPQPDIEIVYSLEPGRWGQGLAIEAADAVLRYAFEYLEIDRVLAEIDEASAALAERLGMRPVAPVAGAPGPHAHYAADRSMWLGIPC